MSLAQPPAPWFPLAEFWMRSNMGTLIRLRDAQRFLEGEVAAVRRFIGAK